MDGRKLHAATFSWGAPLSSKGQIGQQVHILYYSPNACSLAPHILFEETGIPFEARRVDIGSGEHRTPQYRAINPRQRVPAMVVGETVLTEVPALLTYIPGLRPDAKLLPVPGTLEYARCMELVAFISSTLHVAYAQFRRPERFLPHHFPNRDLFVEQGRLNTLNFYREIEDRIGSAWTMGEQYTAADAYLLPFYFWGPRLGLNLAADCPRWTAWKGRMAQRPAVQRPAGRGGLRLV